LCRFVQQSQKQKSGCEAAALLCVTNLYLVVNTFFQKVLIQDTKGILHSPELL